MNKFWNKFVVTLLLLLACLHAACAQSNCVFDAKDLGPSKFAKDINISKYTWDRTSREARIITKDETLISVKYWACDHFGAHALMVVGPYPKDDLANISKKFIQLANMVLAVNEANIVKGYLLKNSVSISSDTVQLNIPNTGYSEFYLRYTIAYDSVLLEIKFYRD